MAIDFNEKLKERELAKNSEVNDFAMFIAQCGMEAIEEKHTPFNDKDVADKMCEEYASIGGKICVPLANGKFMVYGIMDSDDAALNIFQEFMVSGRGGV